MVKMEPEQLAAINSNQSLSITKDSDLSDTTRSIHIITTASLPWMTGTAVNPLLRSLYFQQTRTSPDVKVTLVIPWVENEDQRIEVYGSKVRFSNGKAGRKEQETLVRDWAANKAGMTKESKLIRIQFYPAIYQKKLGSILPLVDICSLIPVEGADIAILEEPGKCKHSFLLGYSYILSFCKININISYSISPLYDALE